MSKIPFHAIPGGELDPHGFTSWDNLFEIGALALTRKPATKETGNHALFQTDLEGLDKAAEMAIDAQHAINDAVEAIGAILAHTKADEIPDYMANVGWLLAGLARLSGRLASEAEEMRYHLAEARQFYQGGITGGSGVDSI